MIMRNACMNSFDFYVKTVGTLWTTTCQMSGLGAANKMNPKQEIRFLYPFERLG